MIEEAIELAFEMGKVGGMSMGTGGGGVVREWLKRTELTATRPGAETAATERLDCRRAFLNIMKWEVQRIGGEGEFSEGDG